MTRQKESADAWPPWDASSAFPSPSSEAPLRTGGRGRGGARAGTGGGEGGGVGREGVSRSGPRLAAGWSSVSGRVFLSDWSNV